MKTLELPSRTDGARLQRGLYERFEVESPINSWNGRILMRMAVQVCNTRSDLDRMVTAIGDLLG